MVNVLHNGKIVATCEFIPNGFAALFNTCRDSAGRTLTVEDVIAIECDPTETDENVPYFEQGEHDHFIAWLSGRVAMRDF